MKYTQREILGELARELEMRKKVYPGLVKNNKLSKVESDKRIGIIKDLIEQLKLVEAIEQAGTLFPVGNKPFKFSEWLKSNGYFYKGKELFIQVANSSNTDSPEHAYIYVDEAGNRVEVFETSKGFFINLLALERPPMLNIPCPINKAQAILLIGHGATKSANYSSIG